MQQNIASQASPPTPLFRQQAIEHISNSKYGTVLLATPLSHRFLTLLFVAIAAAIIAFFAFFSTTRKAQCSGVLLPNLGVIKVVPTQAGLTKLSVFARGLPTVSENLNKHNNNAI